MSTNKSYKCYLVIRLDVQGHPRKPHSGFVLPQFVPVDQPGRMFKKKKKITFPALIATIFQAYMNYMQKKKNKTKTIKKAGEKKTNTDQWRREMPLWHLEHNGRNATIVTYLQHDGS